MELILIAIVIVLLLAGFVLVFWRAGRSAVDVTPLLNKIDHLRDFQERTERSVRDEISRLRTEAQTQAQQERTELSLSVKSFEDSMQSRLSELTSATEKKIESVRLVIDEKLKQIQEDNSLQLDRMRATVDEKLQTTLEKRLGESFKLVSERLEQVQKGLGECRFSRPESAI